MSGTWASALLALTAAGTLVCGAILPVWRFHFFEKRLGLLIGFSAGLMLATALHELLPEALEAAPRGAIWGATAGFLLLYSAERLTHFHACRHRRCDISDEAAAPVEFETAGSHGGHFHHAAGEEAQTLTRLTTHAHASGHTHGHADTMALIGMSIHNFADGLTTAAAFGISNTVGLVVVLAVVLHQLAAGLSLGAIMLRMGRDSKRVLLSTTLTASCILWGCLAFQLLPLGESVQGIVLGFAGGSFLYVAACDLLPEAHAEDEGWSVMAMTLCGFAFVLAIRALFPEHGH